MRGRLGALSELSEEDPRVVARRLFYDCLVYDGRQLLCLIEQFGAMQSSDYAFDIADANPVDSVTSAVDGTQATLILQDNAERFLGVTP